jgi:hypothetical protein
MKARVNLAESENEREPEGKQSLRRREQGGLKKIWKKSLP